MENGKTTIKTTARWILLVFWLWAVVPMITHPEKVSDCPLNAHCCGSSLGKGLRILPQP